MGEPVDGFGMGYVAAKDLAEGDVLLFDTAFTSASLKGEKEFFVLIAERLLRKARSEKRRNSERADAQAEFYYNRIKALPTKDGVDRRWLDNDDDDDQPYDADTREQILLCSIAEACCLQCSEEPDYMALFATASHFNHSCAPNACVKSTRSTAIVRAIAPVPAGTEVTISYLPAQLLCEVTSRRERLMAGRGFTCLCAR